MADLARFIPINRQEHENELRTIIGKHMGNLSGNPTQWVVDAVAEAYQAGFGLGFETGRMPMAPPPPPPAYRVQIPVDPERTRQQHSDAQRRMLPMAERVEDVEPKEKDHG